MFILAFYHFSGLKEVLNCSALLDIHLARKSTKLLFWNLLPDRLILIYKLTH